MPGTGAVLVTGAGGRVAARVVELLSDAGRRVIGLDRPGVAPHRRCAAWFAGDVNVRDDVEHAVASADTVVHLAAVFGTGDPSGQDLLQTNVGGTYNVLDTAHRHGVAKVILVSEASPDCLGRATRASLA